MANHTAKALVAMQDMNVMQTALLCGLKIYDLSSKSLPIVDIYFDVMLASCELEAGVVKFWR